MIKKQILLPKKRVNYGEIQRQTLRECRTVRNYLPVSRCLEASKEWLRKTAIQIENFKR
ncbi:MAG: hypothetical protein HQ557_17135 [Bacteroidetes bacterium]|nr:hypothetical protein [Bacteroidota bacterium]